MQKSRHSPQYRRLLTALRNARKEAGLTQVQVAKSLGVHAPFISKIESGERRVDVVELDQLCALYGQRLTTFLRKIGFE